jgi:hypothetical protein
VLWGISSNGKRAILRLVLFGDIKGGWRRGRGLAGTF